MAKTKLIGGLSVIAFMTSYQINLSSGANILGLFTSSSPSHLIVHMSVVKALAERGHNVTVVVSQKPKVTHKDIKMIIIPPNEEQQEILDEKVASMALRKNNIFTIFASFFGSLSALIDMQADVLKHAHFTELYDNSDTKFDLVIYGFFMNSYQMGVAAKFKAPLIVSWTGPPGGVIDRFIGNPTESSYVPNMFMAVKLGGKMTFIQRLQNLVMNSFFDGMIKILDIRMRRFYNELFPNDGSFPTMDEMYKNVSLVLCNSHFSEGPVRPSVPGVVEIGGIQIKEKADPLPEDIATFLDSANANGAILFSLGSNLKGSSIKPETATYIFNVFSKLKQKVIWKWENLDNTPGKSENILYKKWMPQDDILAHPNLKLFITHAVPMLALPVFADQHGNADKLVTAGYGQKLELLEITEENLSETLQEVLSNPMYKKNVQQFSKLYRDRPLSAQQNVVFWTEYVLRHHGAVHMQSPLVHMNFVENFNLDVFALLLVLVFVLYKIIRVLFRFVCSKCCKTSNPITKNKSQKVKKIKIGEIN